MIELWKDIDGYEGLYKISTHGRVMSMHYKGMSKISAIINASKSSTGYLNIDLYKSGVVKTLYIHVLVAKAFIQNRLCKPEVNHKDGDKANNHVDNLEWVTKSENRKHAFKTGMIDSSPMAGKTGALHPCSRSILQYELNGSFIKKWGSISEAARYYGCCYTSISNCVNGRKKTSAGFVWRPYNGGEIEKVIEQTETIRRGYVIKINQYSLDGEYIKTWKSARSASHNVKCSHTSILNCCKGVTESTGGYKWEYATT